MAEPNASQREQWNGEGGHRWIADAERRDRVLQPVLEVLLEAAALQRGEDVLDIGCGCGVATIAAHARVAPGTAVGLDISQPMLHVARERTADLDGVDFVEADAQTHRFDPRFDVAIGRFGTMFFDDPGAAHANIRSALRSGGRLSLATWQPLTANDWLLVPGAVLLTYGSMPETEPGPGMFAQANADQIAAVLTAAGWVDISVDPVTVELTLGATPAEATDYLADTGIARRVLDTIDPALHSAVLEEVAATLAAHTGASGVQLGAGINIINARHP